MRYMVCAALTLVDPVVARLLFIGLGMDYPEGQVVTFALDDTILLALQVAGVARVCAVVCRLAFCLDALAALT